MENMTVLTRVGNQGQEIYAFQFESDAPVKKEKVSISGNYLDTSIDCFLAMQTGRMADGVQDTYWEKGLLTIYVAPFSSQAPYELRINGKPFTAKDARQVKTHWADDFRPVEENGLRYRIYEPVGEAPITGSNWWVASAPRFWPRNTRIASSWLLRQTSQSPPENNWRHLRSRPFITVGTLPAGIGRPWHGSVMRFEV